MPKLSHSPLPLLSVLLLALALRVWGLTWGLPSATHYFSYHPDESVVLEHASLGMNVFAGQLLPHFYNYGSLQLYLVCFANTLAALFGAVDIVPKNYPAIGDWWPQWAKMYLIGRSLTVGMGVGTVWAVYAIGLRLWGRRAGLLAALTLAIMPLHAQHSHFLTVDVPATFWAVLSLLWAVRLANGDLRPLRAALWAGVFAGLATATKYNMALAILPLVTACWVSAPSDPSPAVPADPPLLGKGKKLADGPPLTGEGGEERAGRGFSPPSFRGRGAGGVGLLAFALAFLAACPGALLETNRFLADLRFEAVHVQNPDDPTFHDTGSGFVYHVVTNLSAGLGWPLLLLTLVSVGYAVYRRERGDGLLAAFALPYYVLISLAAVRYARYTIPLLPILALWTGRMLADAWKFPLPRRVATWAGGSVFLLTLWYTLALLAPMVGTDPRDRAYARLQSEAPTARVGFPAMPWFQTVPISPYSSFYQRGVWRSLTPPEQASRIVYGGKDWDLALLNQEKPEYVILSEYDYADPFRLRDADALRYVEALRWAYNRRYVSIEPVETVRFFNMTSLSPGPLYTQGLPHDMLYPNPYIVIYKRKP